MTVIKFQKYILLLFVFQLSIANVSAQSDISMSTHWYNRANYNPASIARSDYLYLFTDIRRQWTGVNGTPTVFNVQASELNYAYHSAFGISLVSDQIGLTQAINPMLSYAYRIGKNDESWLSLGIAAGVFARYFDGTKFSAVDDTDPVLFTDLENVISPDINIGAEFQSPHYIFGISSTHLLSIGKKDNVYLNGNHIYGYAIYKNTESEFLNYNIGSQVVYHQGITILEGNATIRLKHPTGLMPGGREIFDVGLTYRSSNQLSFLVGLNITNNLRVGYVYDQSLTTGYNSNSTHEIMIEYRIPSQRASACKCLSEGLWYF